MTHPRTFPGTNGDAHHLSESADWVLAYPHSVQDLLWGADGRAFGLGGYGSGYGGGWPRERTGTGRDTPQGMLTETEWRQSLVWARHLCDRNSLAIGFLSHVVNFVVGDGFEWKVVLRGPKPGAVATGTADRDRDGKPDADPAVVACQQVLDEWKELAGWGTSAAHVDPDRLDGDDCSPPADKEAESFRRAVRDGECLLRFWEGDADTAGLPYARLIEPECVRNPADGPTQFDDRGRRYTMGVLHGRDPERRHGYWVCDPDAPQDGALVPAAQMVHLKSNVDGTIFRGYSDFLPVQDGLESLRKLLSNMATVAAKLSRIEAIDEQAPGTTETQVRTMIPKDFTVPRFSPQGTNTQDVKFGFETETKYVNNGRRIQPGPTQAAAASFIQVEQAMLRAVGFRWGCPEYFSGDSSNANFASTLVSGGPFERAAKRRQRDVIGFEQAVAMRVLAFAVKSRRLPREFFDRVTVTITAPDVAIANKLEAAQRHQVYKGMGLSPQTILAEAGYDPDQEAANTLAWNERFPDQSGGMGGAGGDPLAGLFGESADRRLRAVREADEPGGATDAVLAAILDEMIAGGGVIDPDLLDELLSYADDPEHLAAILGEAREDRSHLVKKQITDKNGHKRTVWVNPKAADAKAGRRAARDKVVASKQRASELASKAVGGTLSADELHELAGHLPALSVQELKDVRGRLGLGQGSKLTKQQHVDSLRQHAADAVGGKDDAAVPEVPKPPAPSPADVEAAARKSDDPWQRSGADRLAVLLRPADRQRPGDLVGAVFHYGLPSMPDVPLRHTIVDQARKTYQAWPPEKRAAADADYKDQAGYHASQGLAPKTLPELLGAAAPKAGDGPEPTKAELKPTGVPNQFHNPITRAERTYKYPGLKLIDAVQKDASYPVTMVDPKDLHSSQGHVNGHRMDAIAGDIKNPITLVRHKGKLHVEEGNHRAAKALLDGTPVPAKIIDLNDDGTVKAAA